MNETQSAAEALAVEWSQFQTSWQESKAAWKDQVDTQFEKRFISSMEVDVPKFLAALEALKDELKAAQRVLR